MLRRLLQARQNRGEGGGGGGGGQFPGLRRRLMEQRGGGAGGEGRGGLNVTEDSSVEELTAAKENMQKRVERLGTGLDRARENLKKVEDWLAAKA